MLEMRGRVWAGKLEDLESNFKNEYPESGLVVTGLVGLLAVLLLRKLRRQEGGGGGGGETGGHVQGSQCFSPTCVRCHGEEDVKNHLMQRYTEHLSHMMRRQERSKGDENDIDLENTSDGHSRVLQLIESVKQKHEILCGVYQESGYDTELSAEEPHLWYLFGLHRSPVWNLKESSGFSSFKGPLLVFEKPEVLRAIQAEYQRISLEEAGWKINSVPTGTWKVFPLFNQGGEIHDNTVRCPETARLLKTLPDFMQGNAFGNAMFSSLVAGSTIEPHTGPCNFRLRCHLPLQVPAVGCRMKVGGRSVSWAVGNLLVFDDSYVHAVEYPASDVVGTESRVLLIFDLWHPNVTAEERELLNFLFSN